MLSRPINVHTLRVMVWETRHWAWRYVAKSGVMPSQYCK